MLPRPPLKVPRVRRRTRCEVGMETIVGLRVLVWVFGDHSLCASRKEHV